MSCDVGEATEVTSPTSQLILILQAFRQRLILQAFSHFMYVTAHSDSPSFPSLHLRHSSFFNHSVASPTSQLILQPFRRLSYVTAHSPAVPSLHLVTAHSPTLPSLHLRHTSLSIPSVASPASQLILQPFCCFTYITVHSPTLLSLPLHHKLFT